MKAVLYFFRSPPTILLLSKNHLFPFSFLLVLFLSFDKLRQVNVFIIRFCMISIVYHSTFSFLSYIFPSSFLSFFLLFCIISLLLLISLLIPIFVISVCMPYTSRKSDIINNLQLSHRCLEHTGLDKN
jgi:hypothetical protein